MPTLDSHNTPCSPTDSIPRRYPQTGGKDARVLHIGDVGRIDLANRRDADLSSGPHPLAPHSFHGEELACNAQSLDGMIRTPIDLATCHED